MKSSFRIVDDDGTILDPADDNIDMWANRLLPNHNSSYLSRIHVPRDGQEFFADFGGLPHPRKRDGDGLPVIVTKLTDYQYNAWGERNVMVVKSNKTGMTTSFSLEDFQSRLMPEHAGYDLLLVAQTQKMANEHLLDLKKLVRLSPKYSQFMIDRPDYELFREEKSKLASMYIHNPYNPMRPSRIIALGGSNASAFSWKNVDWVHMSDVSQLTAKDQKMFFGAIFSRLANTNGVIKIETIPGAREGEVWRLWQVANGTDSEKAAEGMDLAEDNADISSTFDPIQLTWQDAVKAGIISINYINKMRKMLDEYTFRQLFEGEFVEVESAWYREEWIKEAEYGAQ